MRYPTMARDDAICPAARYGSIFPAGHSDQHRYLEPPILETHTSGVPLRAMLAVSVGNTNAH